MTLHFLYKNQEDLKENIDNNKNIIIPKSKQLKKNLVLRNNLKHLK